MQRFFLEKPLAAEIVIDGADAHHIGRVLRMKPGDVVAISDADGQSGVAQIEKITSDKVYLALHQRTIRTTEPPIGVWLAQGLPKSDKLEFIIQKAVELGVAGIIPVATHHSVVKYDEKKAQSKTERWGKIAAEAAKQCGRQIVPQVKPIHNLRELLDSLDSEATVFMPYEGESTRTFKAALTEDGSAANKSMIVLIGPEGGFSAEEAQFCRSRGVQTVTLGPRILRAETAALAALAIILYQYGDLGSNSC